MSNKIKITLPDGKEIEATVSDEELASMCKKKKKKKKRERVDGGEYWYVTHTWTGSYKDFFHSLDDECFMLWNYHYTEEEAEFARDKQKAIVRINDRIDELNGEWEYVAGKVYYLPMMCGSTIFTVENDYVHPSLIKEISSKDVANKITEEFDDDLRKYVLSKQLTYDN